MDIRVVVLRALTLCAVHFGRKILDTTIQELERIASRCSEERQEGTPKPEPKLRVFQGGKQ